MAARARRKIERRRPADAPAPLLTPPPPIGPIEQDLAAVEGWVAENIRRIYDLARRGRPLTPEIQEAIRQIERVQQEQFEAARSRQQVERIVVHTFEFLNAHFQRHVVSQNGEHAIRNVEFTDDGHGHGYVHLRFETDAFLDFSLVLTREMLHALRTDMVASFYEEIRAEYRADFGRARMYREHRMSQMRDMMRQHAPVAFERGQINWEEMTNVLTITPYVQPPRRALTGDEEAAAKVRAKDYLVSMLDAEQLAEFQAHDWFHVTGGCSGRRYRIRHAANPYNIDEVEDDGRMDYKLCFIPVSPQHSGVLGYYPPHDVMAIQKLGLELDESVSLSVANRALRTVQDHMANGVGPPPPLAPRPVNAPAGCEPQAVPQAEPPIFMRVEGF